MINHKKFLIFFFQKKPIPGIVAGKTFEICAINGYGQIHSGWFKSQSKALEEVQRITQDARIKGIYLSLNPCHQALSSRSNEKIKKIKSRTSDKDILTIRNLPIDIDPLRPTDTNASDDEHALALETAKQIMSDLKEARDG